MTPPDWRASVVEYIGREAQPKDKFGHQPRLYALACEIGVGEGLPYDDDIVFAAAWMHDLGVFLDHRPKDPEELARWNHVPYTIARTRELLAGWGFPAQKIHRVAAAISTHQAHQEPVEIEAVLLRDADILEQLGAIGALRAFAKVGRDTRYESFTSAFDDVEARFERFTIAVASKSCETSCEALGLKHAAISWPQSNPKPGISCISL